MTRRDPLPQPLPIPWTSVVLPAPRSPVSTTVSRGCSRVARAAPRSRVPSAEWVASSSATTRTARAAPGHRREVGVRHIYRRALGDRGCRRRLGCRHGPGRRVHRRECVAHQLEVLAELTELARLSRRRAGSLPDETSASPSCRATDTPSRASARPCWVCRTNFVAKLPSVTITRGWIDDLLHEPRRAGLDLVLLRVAVPRRPALQDVADVDVAAVESEDVAEDLREQLPGGSDERLSLLVLVEPGRLTDEQHVRIRVPHPEHDLGPPSASRHRCTRPPRHRCRPASGSRRPSAPRCLARCPARCLALLAAIRSERECLPRERAELRVEPLGPLQHRDVTCPSTRNSLPFGSAAASSTATAGGVTRSWSPTTTSAGTAIRARAWRKSIRISSDRPSVQTRRSCARRDAARARRRHPAPRGELRHARDDGRHLRRPEDRPAEAVHAVSGRGDRPRRGRRRWVTPPIAPRNRSEADVPRNATPRSVDRRGPAAARRGRGDRHRPHRVADHHRRHRVRPHPGRSRGLSPSSGDSRRRSPAPHSFRAHDGRGRCSGTRRRGRTTARATSSSRLNPWENSTTGPSGGPAARTASAVPSKASIGPVILRGGPHARSPCAARRFRQSARPARPTATAPAAAAAPTATLGAFGMAFLIRTASGRASPIRLTISYPIVPMSRPSSSAPSSRLPGSRAARPPRRPDPRVRAVHEQSIHRDRPGDPVAPTPDQHRPEVRQLSRVAVRVADRHGRQPRIVFEPVAVPIGDGLAGRSRPRRSPGSAT